MVTKEDLLRIKAVAFDIDGVMTDGGIDRKSTRLNSSHGY